MRARRTTWARLVVALLTALVLAQPASADTGAFVWPTAGWVTATSEYRTHVRHNGSADISTPYWTPVTAARGGTVIYSGWQSYSGARNLIVEIAHGSGYVTRYGHFVEQPVIAVGQTVVTNQLIGYAGRTGRAPEPHLHFAIQLRGQDLPVPGLAWNTWVRRGAPVAGDWSGLGRTSPSRFRYEVRTVEALPVHTAARQSSTVATRVEAGMVLTVLGTEKGYLKVAVGGGSGFIVESGVESLQGRPYGVEVLQATDVFSEAVDGSLLGSLPSGRLATIFEDSTSRLRVLFGLPTVRAWVARADVRPTTRFRTSIAASTDVRTAPDIGAPRVGRLELLECQSCGGLGNDRVNNYQTVYSVREGWYEILYGGARRWIAGWATPGRHKRRTRRRAWTDG